jgi:hypothetical protein
MKLVVNPTTGKLDEVNDQITDISSLQTALNGKVPTSRLINTTSPLTGGGDLSADRTLSIPKATSLINGYLAAADFQTFNSKEPAIMAGLNSQYWRGDKSWQALDTLAVAENTNLYFTNARARAALSGSSPISYNSSTGVISLTTPLTEIQGGTNQTAYTLGDLLYASAASTLSKLAGNITSTKKFLIQTGTGTVSAAPSWGTIAAADIPTANLLGTTNQVNLSAPGTGVLVGGTNIILSLPQSIATTSTVQFGSLGLGVSPSTLLHIKGSLPTFTYEDSSTTAKGRLTSVVSGGWFGQTLNVTFDSGTSSWNLDDTTLPAFVSKMDVRGGFDVFQVAHLTAGTNPRTFTQIFSVDGNSNTVLGSLAALATNATNGFVYIPTQAGAPTGTPTSFAGKVAMTYDTTNNKLYIYNGAWKSVTLA